MVFQGLCFMLPLPPSASRFPLFPKKIGTKRMRRNSTRCPKQAGRSYPRLCGMGWDGMLRDGTQASEHAGPETFSKALGLWEVHELTTAGMPIGRGGGSPCTDGCDGGTPDERCWIPPPGSLRMIALNINRRPARALADPYKSSPLSSTHCTHGWRE